MDTVSIYPKLEQISTPTEKMNVTISAEKKEQEEMVVKNQAKEIREAIAVIDEAIIYLNHAIRRIECASAIGFYDTYCGGGFIYSMMKQDDMKSANSDIRLANKCITKLKEEIKDVEHIETMNLSDLLSFVDVFHDNFFADLMVQQKIEDAEGKCKKVRRKLDDLRKKLRDSLSPEDKTKKEIEEDIKAAFEASNKAIECLQESIRPLEKAAKKIGGDSSWFRNMSIDIKVDDAKIKLRKSVRVLNNLTNKLKTANIDTTKRSEYLKFIDMSNDIISSNNTSYDKKACDEFINAKTSCLKSICEIESIINELKEISVKKDICLKK